MLSYYGLRVRFDVADARPVVKNNTVMARQHRLQLLRGLAVGSSQTNTCGCHLTLISGNYGSGFFVEFTMFLLAHAFCTSLSLLHVLYCSSATLCFPSRPQCLEGISQGCNIPHLAGICDQLSVALTIAIYWVHSSCKMMSISYLILLDPK